MGHTLVLRFDPSGYRKIQDLTGSMHVNKIPFGRDCDREAANRAMKSHLTVFHWGKEKDGLYLPKLEGYRFRPCRIRITGCRRMSAEENSCLLYLQAEPSEGYREMASELERTLRCRTSGFMHVTLAVSKDEKEIRRLEEAVLSRAVFPFELKAEGLDLYHIWKPTRFVRSY